MVIQDSVLTYSEAVELRLRELFSSHGYLRRELDRFDEYALYADHLDFLGLGSAGVGGLVTYTESGGRLMALRPDATLPIARTIMPREEAKIYYHVSVFRRAGLSHELRELSQCGVERFGELSVSDIAQVLILAIKAMDTICPGGILDIAHTGFIEALTGSLGSQDKQEVLYHLKHRDTDAVREAAVRFGLEPGAAAALSICSGFYGSLTGFADALSGLNLPGTARDALDNLTEITDIVNSKITAVINIDFSLSQDVGYYSGIVFQGILPGGASPILSGGRYDALMRKLQKPGGAIGFAVFTNKYQLELYGAKDD